MKGTALTTLAVLAALLPMSPSFAQEDEKAPGIDPVQLSDTDASDPETEEAATADAGDESDCMAPVDPVVSLSYGSRYTEDSETRSDFDEDANAAVNAALEPVDDFISDLTRESNRALTRSGDRGVAAAECLYERLMPWAEADALSDLTTMNANISAPSRLGGIAFAYSNALTVAEPTEEQQSVIEGWLEDRAKATMAYFDEEAPPRASRNNLRQWAAMGVTRIGLTTGDEELVEWGRETVDYTACMVEEDGALPLEMERGDLALHYQMHAVQALVVTAALLAEDDPEIFDACDGAIKKAVDYTLDGFENPERIEARTGREQKIDDAPENFEMAWAVAYLRYQSDPELEEQIADIDNLSNSKLGGDQRLIW